MDVRIIAATNRAIAPGTRAPENAQGLRDDVVARLGAAPIHLPPLRDRLEDLRALAAHFLATSRVPGARFEQPAFRALCLHGWPLNVRELEKIVTTAAVLTGGAKPIALRYFPEPIAAAAALPVAAPTARRSLGGPSPTPEQLEELLRRHEGNVADVSRRTWASTAPPSGAGSRSSASARRSSAGTTETQPTSEPWDGFRTSRDGLAWAKPKLPRRGLIRTAPRRFAFTMTSLPPGSSTSWKNE